MHSTVHTCSTLESSPCDIRNALFKDPLTSLFFLCFTQELPFALRASHTSGQASVKATLSHAIDILNLYINRNQAIVASFFFLFDIIFLFFFFNIIYFFRGFSFCLLRPVGAGLILARLWFQDIAILLSRLYNANSC